MRTSAANAEPITICPNCNGARTISGPKSIARVCPGCEGTGRRVIEEADTIPPPAGRFVLKINGFADRPDLAGCELDAGSSIEAARIFGLDALQKLRDRGHPDASVVIGRLVGTTFDPLEPVRLLLSEAS